MPSLLNEMPISTISTTNQFVVLLSTAFPFNSLLKEAPSIYVLHF